MAEQKEEEKKLEVDDVNFKYSIPPKLTDDELKDFAEEMQQVYNHKCEYKLINDGSAVVFYPAPHIKPEEYGKAVFVESVLAESWITRQNVSKLEGMNDWNEKVIIEDSICSFISCCAKAWTKHYPLKLSPAHILLLVLQSIAIHVDKNSEKLRDKFVQHDDKMELTLYRDKDADNFVFGSKDNDWTSVIEEFCDQIDENTVQETVKLMESDFSCSTLVERISNKVTIMDIMKNYFEYHGYSGCLCGLPQITLNGSRADWIKLRIKCEHLLKDKVEKQFGEKWAKSLLPVLDRFIAVYDGNIDCIFWNSMVRKSPRQYMGSGPARPEQYRGWINVFFPYIQAYQNEFVYNKSCFTPYQMSKYSTMERFGVGAECSKYPTGLSYAPVKWTDLLKNEEHKLKFYSGFVGYKQCSKTFELTPAISWFIGHAK